MALFYKLMTFPKIADTIFNLALNKIFYDDKCFFKIINNYIDTMKERT